jgi:O-methyltransferase
MKTLESAAKAFLRTLGLKLSRVPTRNVDVVPRDYAGVRSWASYTPWNTDVDFQSVYQVVRDYTLVDEFRCYVLWSLVAQVSKLPTGAIVEVGVWRGGSGGLIAHRARRCGIRDTVYLCDTFSGVVKAGALDPHYEGGEHADTSQSTVEKLVAGKLELDNVRVLRGVFPDETAQGIQESCIRFCHIDVDVYESARDVFDWVWPRMAIGGVFVFDDYGFDTCQGIRQYADELSAQSGLIGFYNLSGQFILVKTRDVRH